jgi:pyridoxal phosphate enzyme (YggS family)
MRSTGLETVKEGIRRAALAAGRDPRSITLVAVSKTFAAPEISPVIEAGHRVFGENRVQEAKKKWPDLMAKCPGLELHLIGPLQSNKAAEAVALFDAIHTIDRIKIAEAVAQQMSRQGRSPRLFVQVNTGCEPQKAGVPPNEAGRFIRQCGEELGLHISGLMCIPPVDDDPVPHFKLLASLAADNDLACLSMGMSSDYVEAIECGATHVRVGSAIFGSREATFQS